MSVFLSQIDINPQVSRRSDYLGMLWPGLESQAGKLVWSSVWSFNTLGRLTNRFCNGKRFLHVWGVGVLHKNVSQILAIIDFFKQRNYQKNFVSKEEYYS